MKRIVSSHFLPFANEFLLEIPLVFYQELEVFAGGLKAGRDTAVKCESEVLEGC